MWRKQRYRLTHALKVIEIIGPMLNRKTASGFLTEDGLERKASIFVLKWSTKRISSRRNRCQKSVGQSTCFNIGLFVRPVDVRGKK